MKEPTIQEVLEIVSFKRDANGSLVIKDVLGYVSGNVCGNVWGDVEGSVGGSVVLDVEGNVYGNVGRSVLGDVFGAVGGSVFGNVGGTINGRQWQYVETKQEQIIRLIREGKSEEAIKVLEECK